VRKVSAGAALFILVSATVVPVSVPAFALPSGGAVNQHVGWDTCQAPSTAAMQSWWTGTAYWWIGTYIGGSARSCSQPNLSAAWYNTTYNQGWRFMPIWVGPQAPCSAYASRFSYDVNTAYQQGLSEAESAYLQLVNFGFGSNANGTPIVYDLEGFNPASTSCLNAVKSFIQGWISQLHIPAAQVAGVYGSSCSSHLNDMASYNPVPDFIWGGDFPYGGVEGNSHTSTLTCVNNGYWTSSQRLKQYWGQHNESHGGVQLLIDVDCANGPLAPTFQYGTESQCL
jgi:hypothetical protein